MKRLFAKHRRAGVSLACVLVIFLLITVSNLFSGLPDPKQPSSDLFVNPDETSWTSLDDINETYTAFAERPLFSATRRIKVPPAVPDAAPEPELAGPILSLDKWSLLGIFDSGEVEGALIRHPKSGRHRLVVGEQVDGWELISVDPRSVRFSSIAGDSQAELSMALATVEVLPVPEPDGGAATASVSAASASTRQRRPESVEVTESGDAAEAPEIITPSFKDFYGGPRSKQD